MIFISVDLPAPFSPSTAWISPAATRRLTRSLALTAGYCLLMSTSSRRSMRISRKRLGGVAIVVRTAGDESLDEVALVGERHPREDPLMQSAGHRRPTRRDGADVCVWDSVVGDPARVERADLGAEAERLGGAARCRVQRLPRRQALAGEGLD